MHRLTDNALSGLAAALDCGRMRAALAQAVGREPAALSECAIERVKYRPGRSALVLYRIALADAAPAREALVYAAVYPAGTRLRAFPEDRKLPALPLFADAERLRAALLPQVAAARWGTAVEPGTCSVSRVSYFPEHAYTARVDARLGDGRSWPLYAKTQFTSQGARTFAVLRRLWETRATREQYLQHVRPVLYQDAASALWQEALAGSTLEALATQGRLSAALAARVGNGVAALHGAALDIAGLSSCSAASRLARLHEVLRVLAAVLPRSAARARRLVARLERSAPHGEAACSALHGDLHLNNILVESGRIALIDLDDLCRGPAELELGSFAAALVYRAQLHDEPVLAERAIEPFLEGYREKAPRPVRTSHVRWHAAAALICERAWRALTSLKPGRLERMDRLLDAASALAA
jgi:aminoglycoside phosphotransferase (APT) family kinase protein